MPGIRSQERSLADREMRPPGRQSNRKCGSSGALLATKPRELERFIDSGYSGGLEARASQATLATTYATSISWDGLTTDPRPFARFDEHNTITFAKKPVGNGGARVIELEGHAPGGIFGRPATGPGRVPWTVEQETTRVLAPDNPFRQAATDGGNAVMDRPYFDSTMVVVPKVEAGRPPTCLPRAGKQGSGALLTPEERRQMNDYEVRMQSATSMGRKARHQKTRLNFILSRRYPEGAIGVDSPSNPTSEARAEKKKARDKAETASRAQATARRKRLDELQGNPHPRFGYNPWQHPDLPAGGGIQHGVSGEVAVHAVGGSWQTTTVTCRSFGCNGGERFLQAKGRAKPTEENGRSIADHDDTHPSNTHHNAAKDTHHRLFGSRGRVPKSDPRVRSQALWDEGAGRRRYDIVTGVRPLLKTQLPERPPGRLAHPSQQSLERGRNLHGSLVAA